MVIGIAKVKIYISEANSLKEKRQVLRSIFQKIDSKFKRISIAEVDGHDLWQKVVIGISLVGKDKEFVDSRITNVLNFLNKESEIEIIEAEIEFLNY